MHNCEKCDFISSSKHSKAIRIGNTHKKAATVEDLKTSQYDKIDQIDGSFKLLEELNKVSNLLLEENKNGAINMESIKVIGITYKCIVYYKEKFLLKKPSITGTCI